MVAAALNYERGGGCGHFCPIKFHTPFGEGWNSAVYAEERKVQRVFNAACHFLALIEKYEFDHGKALAQFVNFVHADLPYNIKWVQDAENSPHCFFVSADMKAMAKHCANVLFPSSHGHVFCSTL